MEEAFFKEEVPVLLQKLTPDTKPQWGILTPQAMIEHIAGSWRISNGNARVKQVTPDEQLDTYRAMLFSDKPYQKNQKNPIMPADAPPPHRKPDLASAKQQLLKEIEAFFAYYEANPDAIEVHPIFGKLDKQGWLTFQDKHMKHHFRQFGLIE